jgi:hypothetical protein
MTKKKTNDKVEMFSAILLLALFILAIVIAGYQFLSRGGM